MIMIGTTYGLPTLFGSIIASGVVIFLLSFFMDKIMKLFPQVVVGTFVTLIGVSLAPSALRDLAGGEGAATFASLPNLVLFGVITSSGISILSRLDFGKNNNFKIVGTSIAIGVGSLYASEVYQNLPEAVSMVLSNGLFMVTLSAVVLNLLLNGRRAFSVDED